MVGKIQEKLPSYPSATKSSHKQKKESDTSSHSKQSSTHSSLYHDHQQASYSHKQSFTEEEILHMLHELNASPFCQKKNMTFIWEDQQISVYHIHSTATSLVPTLLQILTPEVLHHIWQQYTQFQSFELKGKIVNISC
jgi:hypothetical protein